METYSYTAVAKDGKDKKGQIEAETRDEAARKLKEQGLTPMSIKTQTAFDKDIELPFLTKKKVKPRDMSVFCRQFASILNAGVSVVNALEMLAEQTENKNLKKAIMDAQSGVEKGETLSDSMRQDSGIFPSILIDMVKAGESSGSLENALTRMAIQFEKQAKTQGIVKKAMMYPCVLLVVMVGVIIVMLTFVIPNFVSMFEDLESDLPFMTKAVLSMSDAVMNYWYIIIAVIAAIVVGYKMYVKTDAGRHSVDKLKLKIPVFGVLQTKTACASFARTLSTLLQAGMPMIEAIDIAASTNTIESSTGVWIKSITFSDPVAVYTFGQKASSNPSNTSGSAYQTNNVGYKETINVSYEGTYAEWKNLIGFINNYEKKNTIEALTTTYNEATDVVTGTMTLALYSITGNGREFSEPKFDLKTGTDNIFAKPAE